MTKSTFPDGMRFNWGKHDAEFDIKHHHPVRYLPTTFHQSRPLPSWDKVYCKGYASAYKE